jgi:heme-degrading monooxygenase HmoA
VITRVWRCSILPARADELVDWIAGNSWPSVRVAPGFEGGALYLPMDGKDQIVTVSNWADKEAIANYAGPDWQGTPIVYEYERAFMTSVATVEHFERVQVVRRPEDDGK